MNVRGGHPAPDLTGSLPMQFRQNAAVHTLTGQTLGRLARVVLDPDTNAVTHIVVRPGRLFAEARMVPVDQIGAATEKGILLMEEASELEAFPRFEETQYARAASPPERAFHETGQAQPLFWYPAPGEFPPVAVVPPTAAAYAPQAELNVPAGNVALKEGAPVIAADGVRVGTVERVLTDPGREEVTELMIAEGLLVKERRRVPMRWVREVREHEVRLSVGSHIVEELGFEP
jgi:uncharacterized protein YrrD